MRTDAGGTDAKGDRDVVGDDMARDGTVWAPSPWESAFCLVPISFHFAFSHVHSQIKLQTAQMCVKTHTHTERGRQQGSQRAVGEGRREKGELWQIALTHKHTHTDTDTRVFSQN